MSKVDKKKSVPKLRKDRKPLSQNSNEIILDPAAGLTFKTEQELYEFFQPQVDLLERVLSSSRKPDDIPEEELSNYEELLETVLEEPDEVWLWSEPLDGFKVYVYMSHFQVDEDSIYYVATTYRVDDIPVFVYLHFPTRDFDLADQFRKGELIYDRVLKIVEKGALDGDALGQGEDLAVGLYQAMLKLRANSDIVENKFISYGGLREPSINEPDEIWKSTDLSGHSLVTFIREYGIEDLPFELRPKKELPVYYVVITVEEDQTNQHALLFSFPTTDEALVTRYRHGENLQSESYAKEVVPAH